MPTEYHIAVLFDAKKSHEPTFVDTLTSYFSDAFPLSMVEMFPVSTSPVLFATIRKIQAKKFTLAFNLCTGSAEEADAVNPVLVAFLLEQHQVPYTGCRIEALCQPLDILFMMLWYAGLPLPKFSIVKDPSEIPSKMSSVQRPTEVRSCSPWGASYSLELLGSGFQALEHKEKADLENAMGSYGNLVVWEKPHLQPSNRDRYADIRVLVFGLGKEKTPLVWIDAVSPKMKQSLRWGMLESQLNDWGKSFVQGVLYNVGIAALTFSVPFGSLSSASQGDAVECFLWDVTLNPTVFSFKSDSSSLYNVSEILQSLAAMALEEVCPPVFSVELHEDSRKGYRLCAARDLKESEVVFPDEGRSFAIVTRPFVEANWDDSMKKTFTEYAWPLDSEGHVYAIWEKSPSRWRPINHSCDPNCIFATPHSLNVIASRPIQKGEDLTMDYATFCDGTMSSFECLCGASCCRKWIQADEASLRKYGENSWLRRVPGPVRSIFNQVKAK